MTELFVDRNNVVTLDFEMKNDKGEILDSSRDGGDRLVYLHGNGNLPPRLEQDLAGRKVNENIRTTLTPEDGFGVREEQGCIEVPREQFEGVDDLQLGMPFQLSAGGELDETVVYRVTAMTDDVVTLDSNHPLAGHTTIWDCTIVGIRAATDDEIAHGHVHGDGGCGHDHSHDDHDHGDGHVH